MASPFTPPTIPGAQGYPLGLTGVTGATRYVGATASGAPASGTFAVGDFSIDQTGALYVCTVAGSPGTWSQVGGSAATPTDGWVSDSATWTRTANTTFTVSGDVTTTFTKGTRLKVTDTTTKYFVVVSSSHAAGTTTVTITGGSDYVLAATPTARWYSYSASPQGYPGVFAYTPVWSSNGTPPTLGDGSIGGSFSVVGKTCSALVTFVRGSTSTNGTGTYEFSLPIAYATDWIGVGYLLDSGTVEYAAISRTAAGAGAAILTNTASTNGQYWTPTTPFTLAVNDQAKVWLSYQF